ncbi:MAG: hypothetical protein WC071_13455, partial [Victivallaceae bacterium]
MPVIDQYLNTMLDQGGSDLHLSINHPAKTRINGQLTPLSDDLISAEFMEQMLHEICPEFRWKKYLECHDMDFAHEITGRARFRTNYLYNYHGMAAVLRQIPSKIKTLDELQLPKVLVDICNLKNGLV